MPIASTLETMSKTRRLDPPFPKTTPIGVRLQPRATDPQLRNSQKERTKLTGAVLSVLDLLCSQKLQLVLQQRRTTPPLDLRLLDLRLRPDPSLREIDAKVSLMQTLARADARSIATANSAQSRRTSVGAIKKDIQAANSSSASAERMEKRTDQLFYQDANAIAKEDAKNQLCFFFKLYFRFEKYLYIVKNFSRFIHNLSNIAHFSIVNISYFG